MSDQVSGDEEVIVIGGDGLSWDDVVGKPELIDECVAGFLGMRNFAAAHDMLKSDDALGDIKGVLNSMTIGMMSQMAER